MTPVRVLMYFQINVHVPVSDKIFNEYQKTLCILYELKISSYFLNQFLSFFFCSIFIKTDKIFEIEKQEICREFYKKKTSESQLFWFYY